MKITMRPITPRFKLDDTATQPETLLSKRDSKTELKRIRKLIKPLHERLMAENTKALLCIFQAMDAAGKDGTIRAVFSGLNPVGIHASAFGRPTQAELQRDYLWRVHQHVPQKGKIGIFNRSHYEEVVTVRVFPEFLKAQNLPDCSLKALMKQRINDIVAFERLLSQTGTRILKFFLNVGLAEQKRRLLARMDVPEKNWKHDGHDLNCRERWSDFMTAYEIAIKETNQPHAPWFCVPADDKPTMRVMVAQKIHDTLLEMSPDLPKVDETDRAKILEDRKRLVGL